MVLGISTSDVIKDLVFKAKAKAMAFKAKDLQKSKAKDLGPRPKKLKAKTKDTQKPLPRHSTIKIFNDRCSQTMLLKWSRFNIRIITCAFFM